jgi:hypothetical protein
MSVLAEFDDIWSGAATVGSRDPLGLVRDGSLVNGRMLV